jgi:hypothetical protein
MNRYTYKTILVLIVSMFGLSGCNSFRNDSGDRILAKVNNKILTQSQLKNVIPPSMKEIDSILFAQNYIEKWVKNQLLLEKAEFNLDEPTKESINDLIENYRTSLMVFKYQQLLIDQKLDTVITESELKDYYMANMNNFRLDSNVAQAVFVQIPKTVYDGFKIRQWLRTGSENDLANLEDYCYQNAHNFDIGDEWRYMGELTRLLPKHTFKEEGSFLINTKYAESQDSLYYYFISVRDYRLVNDLAPINFVQDKIKEIILNQRKSQLVKDLENRIYLDAVNQKKFTIYTN